MGYPLKGLFPDRGFFGNSHSPYESGVLSALKPSSQSLWGFFFHVCNRVSSPCFTVAESVIQLEIGLTPNTIGAARKQLEKARLIRCERASSSSAPYIYHLMNPETNEPLPAEGHKPATYKPIKGNSFPVAPEEAYSAAVSDRSAAQPSMATPTPIQELATRKSTAVPRGGAVQRMEGIYCKHGTMAVWHRDDGSSVCGICHPSINQETAFSRRTDSANTLHPPTHSPITTDMTEHGLYLKF